VRAGFTGSCRAPLGARHIPGVQRTPTEPLH